MKFSKSTGNFYPSDFHYPNLPDDLIDVTDEDYAAAMSRPAGHAFDFVAGSLVISAPVVTARDLIIARIAELEGSATPRRMREAALGTDGGWLKALDAQIAALRATLA